MRTVILFGLMLVATAINETIISDRGITLPTIILIVAIFMDIVDFVTKKSKKW
jgi:hypothetical protein